MTNEFSESDLEKLKSIINYYIGLKTSAAFSSLLGDKVEYETKIYYKNLAPYETDYPPSNEIILCSTFLTGEGDIKFRILYTLIEEHAKKLAAKLLCLESLKELNEISQSSIKEVGNILTGSFFNAVCDGTNFQIDLSTPDFTMGSLDEAFTPIKKSIRNIEDMVTADVVLESKSKEIKLRMIIIQEKDDAKKLLSQYMLLAPKIKSN